MRLYDDNASFRINQDGLRKFLGDLESEIMELVWKKANPTVTVFGAEDRFFDVAGMAGLICMAVVLAASVARNTLALYRLEKA